MKNEEAWRPTKYVFRGKQLTGTRNTKELGVGSRLVADIIAESYQNAIPEYCRGDLLDLGCGKVPFYELYRPFVTSTVCVDWEHTLHGTSYLDHTFDLGREIPLESESFDTVLFSDVLEHVPDPELTMGEIFRILRPGGNLIMNVPFMYWLHELPYDYYRYTEFGLRRLAENAGFEIKTLRPVGGVPEVITDIVSKQLMRYGNVGKRIAAMMQSTCSWFIHTAPGRKISTTSAKRVPFGYFAVCRRPGALPAST